MFSHPYSALTVSECIVSTVVTLMLPKTRNKLYTTLMSKLEKVLNTGLGQSGFDCGHIEVECTFNFDISQGK